jgi:hypothetical protein
MQPGLETTIGFAETVKPILDSYDSGEECSLIHWMELCRLINESDLTDREEFLEPVASEV